MDSILSRSRKQHHQNTSSWAGFWMSLGNFPPRSDVQCWIVSNIWAFPRCNGVLAVPVFDKLNLGACSVNAIRHQTAAQMQKEIVLIILDSGFCCLVREECQRSWCLVAPGQIWPTWMMDCIRFMFLVNPRIVNYLPMVGTNCQKTQWKCFHHCRILSIYCEWRHQLWSFPNFLITRTKCVTIGKDAKNGTRTKNKFLDCNQV